MYIQPHNQKTAQQLEKYKTTYKPCSNNQHILQLNSEGKIIDILTIKQFIEEVL